MSDGEFMNKQIRFFCVFSAILQIFFYFYLLILEGLYSDYTLNLVSSNESIRWFKAPEYWHAYAIVFSLAVYLLLFFGFTIFRHALVFLILINMTLGFSSETTVLTSIDMVLLDLWRFSDGILLYLLYLGPKFSELYR